MALLLRPATQQLGRAGAGLAIGYATAVKLTNGVVGAVLAVLVAWRHGLRQALPYALGGARLAAARRRLLAEGVRRHVRRGNLGVVRIRGRSRTSTTPGGTRSSSRPLLLAAARTAARDRLLRDPRPLGARRRRHADRRQCRRLQLLRRHGAPSALPLRRRCLSSSCSRPPARWRVVDAAAPPHGAAGTRSVSVDGAPPPVRVASTPMSTSVVTGGAGFLGSHLCEALLARGPPRHLRRQPRDRLARQHRAPPRRRVRLPAARPDAARRDRRAGRLRLPPREPGEPDRLPAAAAADAQGRLVRHAQRARPRQGEAGPLPARLDERGVRRPAGAPAAGDLLGARQPDRPARRLRRGEALRRGAHDGVPPPAGRRHGDRADLQHLRPSHATARRARDPDLHPPGARGEAADGVRQRRPDAELLLRRRSRPRPDPARRVGRAPARSTSATRPR